MPCGNHRDTRVAIRKPGVRPEKIDRPKVDKDFFEGVKGTKKKVNKK
jgi:hypothetical protein